MANVDYIDKANLIGSFHGFTACPYKLWTGEEPDLLTLPMIPFGSVVMAHVPSTQQSIGRSKSIFHNAVGTAMWHNKGGLRLFNPKTKKEIIRQTYKSLGPTPQSHTRLEYELAKTGEVTHMPVFQDSDAVSLGVDDYKCLIGTLHRDINYELELFKTVDVVEETFDEDQGPIILAYRRRVTKTG